jgi:peptidyl-prolyl cis-trans isomerase C
MIKPDHRSWTALALAATLLSAGCSKGAPEGQVVARVNGDEITQAELGVEMAAAGVPAAQRAKAGPVILQRVIERKLLAQAADKEGIAKEPDFVLVRDRSNELLLAQRYLQRESRKAVQTPGSDQIAYYLRSHPALADNRELLTLDQIRFPTPTDATELQALQGATTMDALTGVLRARQVQFTRNTVQADSATLPQGILSSINKLKPGEPLVIIGGPVLTAAVITNRQPLPTTPAQATEMAKQRIQAEAVDNRLKQENAALHQGAKIEYGKGMAPPAKAAKR